MKVINPTPRKFRQTTPINHFQPVIATQNNFQDSDDIVTRSREDEKRVFAVISRARENDIGIQSFNFQVNAVTYRTATYHYLKSGIVKSILNTANLLINFTLFPSIKMRTLQV